MRISVPLRLATMFIATACIFLGIAGTAVAAPTADLALTGSVAELSPTVHRGAGYTLTLRNLGPDQANGVSVAATLPAGVTITSATSAAGNCTTNTNLSCNFGKLDVGQTATVSVVFYATTGGTRTVNFVATTSSTDPVAANNTASVTLRVAPCTHTGTAGNDTLVGTTGIDVICGGAGNDMIRGRGGNDILRGGIGADTIYGGSGRDAIRGGAGNDWISGGAGVDRMYGQSGRDTLMAKDGLAELVNGGLGTDRARVDRMLDIRRSIERLI